MRSGCSLRPFRDLSKWIVCSVLMFLDIPGSSSQPVYQWQDRQTNEILVCQQCPPGTFVAQHCTKDKPTLCQPCPSSYYTQYWNYLDKCLYCNIICSVLEEEVRPCNSTHNRLCQCKPGYHFESDFCIRHSKCPMGTGAVQSGSPHEDTKCIPCAMGTFSSSSSSTDQCQLHQNCAQQGLEVNVLGTQFHDTFCTSCTFSAANDTSSGSAYGDCQEAIIDFVPYQVKSRRKLLRMIRAFSKHPSQNHRKSQAELQVELHAYLIQLKNSQGKESVVQKLLGSFHHMKIIHQEVQKRFPLGLSD